MEQIKHSLVFEVLRAAKGFGLDAQAACGSLEVSFETSGLEMNEVLSVLREHETEIASIVEFLLATGGKIVA